MHYIAPDNLDRLTAVELLVIGAFVFAFFAPVVYSTPTYGNCVFSPSVTSMCPNMAPSYASLTYAIMGHGAAYLGGHYSVRW